MPKHILVIGSANVDFSMQVPFFPRKGESVNGGPFVQSFGGKGSNQALAARRAGADVAVVFNLGGDVFADRLVALYEEEGIDARHARRNPGQQCGTGIILVDANGDNLICTSLEANGRMTAEMVADADELFADAAMLLLQMEVPDAALAQAIGIAKRRNVPVMMNFAPARETELTLDAGIDILVVNESEAENLTKSSVSTVDEARLAAERLSRLGPSTVVVTLGENGCVARNCGNELLYRAFSVNSRDSTAAGDSFCGALAAALAEGKPFEDALVFASAAGALCASVVGALASIPRRQAIMDFLSRNNDLPKN